MQPAIHEERAMAAAGGGSESTPETDTNSTLETESSTGSNEHSPEPREGPPSEYSVNMTSRILLLASLFSAVFAFSIGTIWRVIVLEPRIYHSYKDLVVDDSDVQPQPEVGHSLPSPKMMDEYVPQGTYVSKVYQSKAFSTSHTIHLDRTLRAKKKALVDEEEDDSSDDESEIKEREHLPAGQQLLVDFKDVEYRFLNSEERLAHALVGLMEEAELSLLSYNCHSMVPIGVSCVGVLVESHIAFHTWPKEGVIFFDLSTNHDDDEPLTLLLPLIKKWFAPTHSTSGDSNDASPESWMQWSYHRRGFREGFAGNYQPYEHPLDQELGFDLLQMHGPEFKVPVLEAEETDFQHVDVYELRKPGGWLEKILYLDGTRQSSLRGEAAYHEALVHPAMVTHPNPKRVAIIGGGEGATLREVLKHNTVEYVLMVEIDGQLVELCAEYLPEWSNCSDIAGSDAESCFDDSRASVVFDDAFGWFINAFGGPESQEEKFDVIIMDALDPDQLVPIVGSLYKDNNFVESVYKGLSDNGIFVVQDGEADELSDSPRGMGPYQDEANLMHGLENVGFKSIHIYDEGHSHFDAPWAYLLCLKDASSRDSWYRTASEIDVELRKRIYPTKSGAPPLLFVDAPMMVSYQLPSKEQETCDCRKTDAPWECFDYLGAHHAPEDFPNKATAFIPAFERHLRQVLDNDTDQAIGKHQHILCTHHSEEWKERIPICSH